MEEAPQVKTLYEMIYHSPDLFLAAAVIVEHTPTIIAIQLVEEYNKLLKEKEGQNGISRT